VYRPSQHTTEEGEMHMRICPLDFHVPAVISGCYTLAHAINDDSPLRPLLATDVAGAPLLAIRHDVAFGISVAFVGTECDAATRCNATRRSGWLGRELRRPPCCVLLLPDALCYAPLHRGRDGARLAIGVCHSSIYNDDIHAIKRYGSGDIKGGVRFADVMKLDEATGERRVVRIPHTSIHRPVSRC
jgi:hypothetical protein